MTEVGPDKTFSISRHDEVVYETSELIGTEYEWLATRAMTPHANHSVCRLAVPPGLHAPTNSHDVDESIYLVEGELDMVLDGDDYKLSAGDSMWWAAGVPHSFHNRGETAALLVVVFGGGLHATYIAD